MSIAIPAGTKALFRSSWWFNRTSSERPLAFVVVPLVAASAFASPDSDVGPHFVIDGRTVVLDPLQITNVPGAVLGPFVASLTGEADRVIRALDILLSRAWR